MMPNNAPMTILAYDYMPMFNMILKDFPRNKGHYTNVINWAKTRLKRRDRIVWWLRGIRLHEYHMVYSGRVVTRDMMERGDTKSEIFKREKYQKPLENDAKFFGIEPIDVGEAFRNQMVEATAAHYLSLNIPKIDNTIWNKQLPVELWNSFRGYEREWREKHKGEEGLLNPQPVDKIIEDFGNGWAWWMLGRSHCSEEAQAMGHCGNAANGPRNTDDHILSLRHKTTIGKTTGWEPHLTFILGANGFLGEMKGRANQKPSAKFHPYIVGLLKNPIINGIKGGGYKPENNFSMSDLPEDQRKEVLSKNRKLMTLEDMRKEDPNLTRTPELLEKIKALISLDSVPGVEFDSQNDCFTMWTFPSVREMIAKHSDRDVQTYVSMMFNEETKCQKTNAGLDILGCMSKADRDYLVSKIVMTERERDDLNRSRDREYHDSTFSDEEKDNNDIIAINHVLKDFINNATSTLGYDREHDNQLEAIAAGARNIFNIFSKAWSAGITPDVRNSMHFYLRNVVTSGRLYPKELTPVFPDSMNIDFWDQPVKMVLLFSKAFQLASEEERVEHDYRELDSDFWKNFTIFSDSIDPLSNPYRKKVQEIEADPQSKEKIHSFTDGLTGWSRTIFIDGSPYNYLRILRKAFPGQLDQANVPGAWDEVAARNKVMELLRALEPKTSSLDESKVAYDYMEMFGEILKDFPDIRDFIKYNVDWAKERLKKRDRVTWYCRWFRFCEYRILSDPKSSHSIDMTPEKAEKYKKYAEREKARLDNANGDELIFQNNWNINAYEAALIHYLSLPIAGIQNIVWAKQTPDVLLAEFRALEYEWVEKTKGALSPHPGDKPIITFGDGWAWWMLDRSYCSEEAKAMGHCGNAANGPSNPDDRILSLRQPVKRGKQTMWEPHVTFILGANGVLGEMKGRGNDKPAAKYHPYIIELLKHQDIIKGIRGGGYKPENNFSTNDLPEDQKLAVLEANPALKTLADLYKAAGNVMTPEVLDKVKKILNLNIYDDNLKAFLLISYPSAREMVERIRGLVFKALFDLVNDTPDVVTLKICNTELNGVRDVCDVMSPEELKKIADELLNSFPSRHREHYADYVINYGGVGSRHLVDFLNKIISGDTTLRGLTTYEANDVWDTFREVRDKLLRAWYAGITDNQKKQMDKGLRDMISGQHPAGSFMQSITDSAYISSARPLSAPQNDPEFWDKPYHIALKDQDAITEAMYRESQEYYPKYKLNFSHLNVSDEECRDSRFKILSAGPFYTADNGSAMILDNWLKKNRELSEPFSEGLLRDWYNDFLKGHPYQYLKALRAMGATQFDAKNVERAWDDEVAHADAKKSLNL